MKILIKTLLLILLPVSVFSQNQFIHDIKDAGAAGLDVVINDVAVHAVYTEGAQGTGVTGTAHGELSGVSPTYTRLQGAINDDIDENLFPNEPFVRFNNYVYIHLNFDPAVVLDDSFCFSDIDGLSNANNNGNGANRDQVTAVAFEDDGTQVDVISYTNVGDSVIASPTVGMSPAARDIEGSFSISGSPRSARANGGAQFTGVSNPLGQACPDFGSTPVTDVFFLYSILDDVNVGAENGMQIVALGTPNNADFIALPIELVYFNGAFDNGDNLLQWKTSSEINNSGFRVLRSTDNNTSFEELAFVEGYGNSNIDRYYSYRDVNPPIGQNYYKIEQFDYDGTKTVSDVIAIRNKFNSNIAIYPNPANDLIYIKGISENTTVNVYSTLGKLVTKKQFLSKGVNNTIDVSHFNKGLYMVEVISKERIQQVKKIFIE